MSCGCRKIRIAPRVDKVRELAIRASKIDKSDYIIYELEGETYFDKKSCWKKAGRPGVVKELICYP
jgi:hypothetical protein